MKTQIIFFLAAPIVYQLILHFLITISNLIFIWKNINQDKKLTSKTFAEFFGLVIYSYLGMFYAYTTHQLKNNYSKWFVIVATLIYIFIYLVYQKRLIRSESQKLLIKKANNEIDERELTVMANSISALDFSVYILISYIIFLFFEKQSDSFSFGLNQWLYHLAS